MSIKSKLTQGGDGTAIPAGMVGEVISSKTSAANYSGSGAFENITTITLTRGVWLVSGAVRQTVGTATAATDFEAAISAYTGNTTTDMSSAVNQVLQKATTTATEEVTATLPTIPVYYDGTNITINGTVVNTSTLYLKSRLNYSGGIAQRNGSITAVRIA